MSIKTFFQPWLIQPTFPTFAGEVNEYDPLREAHDLSLEATGWVTDVVNQLTYANELYAEAAEHSKDEMARHKDRRSAALQAMAVNDLVIGVIEVAVPLPVEPPLTPDEVQSVIAAEPEVDDSEELHDNPWYVPAPEPEPEAPKTRRRRKAEVKEQL